MNGECFLTVEGNYPNIEGYDMSIQGVEIYVMKALEQQSPGKKEMAALKRAAGAVDGSEWKLAGHSRNR